MSAYLLKFFPGVRVSRALIPIAGQRLAGRLLRDADNISKCIPFSGIPAHLPNVEKRALVQQRVRHIPSRIARRWIHATSCST